MVSHLAWDQVIAGSNPVTPNDWRTEMVLSCTCKHEGQDKVHGVGRRVHNRANDDPEHEVWRCTVCNAKQNFVKPFIVPLQ